MVECNSLKTLWSLVLWSIQHPGSTLSILPKYFTIWMLVFVVFYAKLHRYVDLLLLTMIVAVFGLYITYISPKKLGIMIDKRDFSLCGLPLYIIDTIFHQLPFWFVLLSYGRYYKRNQSVLPTLVTLFIIIVYISFQAGLEHNYNLAKKDIVTVSKIILVLVLIFFLY